MIFICHVDINLDKFTFQNNNDYTVKKDAIRKTYVLLGNALGISKQKLGNYILSQLLLSWTVCINELLLPFKALFHRYNIISMHCSPLKDLLPSS